MPGAPELGSCFNGVPEKTWPGKTEFLRQHAQESLKDVLVAIVTEPGTRDVTAILTGVWRDAADILTVAIGRAIFEVSRETPRRVPEVAWFGYFGMTPYPRADDLVTIYRAAQSEFGARRPRWSADRYGVAAESAPIWQADTPTDRLARVDEVVHEGIGYELVVDPAWLADVSIVHAD